MSQNGKPPVTEQRLLTVQQASRYLNIHEQTVYLWARTGRLPYLKLGRSVRFDKLALDQWIRKKIEENEEKLLPWADDGCAPIGRKAGVCEPPYRHTQDFVCQSC